MEKKILIAIDGSVYSDQSLSYAASFFKNQDNVSFHLLTCISSSSALPQSNDAKNTLLPESLAHQTKLGVANLRLKKATQKLSDHGINNERVTSSSVSIGANICMAIQHEARRLLVDAIVVGRRGLGRVGEMFMGSVSAALFKRCHSIPLWVIDGEVQSTKILVPLDCTIHSFMATDHLAHIFANRDDINFYLFHCQLLFGKKPIVIPEKFDKQWDKKWRGCLKDEKDFLLHGPAKLLIDAGIKKENIEILPETTDLEESHSIIRKASRLKCGTIVMGRRGVGMAKGLFGGVSDRTLNKTENMALWVVG